jgi:hypothetical protein
MNQQEAVPELKKLMLRLPTQNRISLHYLFDFFKKIILKSDKNLMTSYNLSIIFGAIMFRSSNLSDEKKGSMEIIHLANTSAKLLEIIIDNFDEIFRVKKFTNLLNIQYILFKITLFAYFFFLE